MLNKTMKTPNTLIYNPHRTACWLHKMRYLVQCNPSWNSSEKWTYSGLLLFIKGFNFLLTVNNQSCDCRDLDDVIKRANNTTYGLAAGVFTKNLDTANTLTRALRVGVVWVNCFSILDAGIPFGGYKMSGQGRENGIYSLLNYLQVKAVVTPLKNPSWL